MLFTKKSFINHVADTSATDNAQFMVDNLSAIQTGLHVSS